MACYVPKCHPLRIPLDYQSLPHTELINETTSPDGLVINQELSNVTLTLILQYTTGQIFTCHSSNSHFFHFFRGMGNTASSSLPIVMQNTNFWTTLLRFQFFSRSNILERRHGNRDGRIMRSLPPSNVQARIRTLMYTAPLSPSSHPMPRCPSAYSFVYSLATINP
jgi:hypothetical protein